MACLPWEVLCMPFKSNGGLRSGNVTSASRKILQSALTKLEDKNLTTHMYKNFKYLMYLIPVQPQSSIRNLTSQVKRHDLVSSSRKKLVLIVGPPF